MRPHSALVFAPVFLAVCMQAYGATPLAPLAELQHAGAKVSALVVRLDDDETIASLTPGRALTPASVSKLYVAAAALQRLGPDFQFHTRLLGSGSVKDGVLDGDLVLAGIGDPALTDSELWQLAHNAAESGLKQVTGDLVVNTSYFGALKCEIDDRCKADKLSEHTYDAPLSAAGVDFSSAGLTVIPAPVPGNDAKLVPEPFALPMLEISGRVATVSSRSTWRVSVTRFTRDGRDDFRIAGTVPAGSAPRTFYRSVSDPDRFAGETLRAFLAQAGVNIAGGIRVQPSKPPTGSTIAVVKGQPLWILLRRMLTWSNNFMADTLALDLLRQVQKPPLDLAIAGAALTIAGRALEAGSPLMLGRRPQVKLLSGSGLTPQSRASARDVVALLDVLYHRNGLLPSFLGSLTVPQYTPTHLLKTDGNPMWMTRIAAKTGSLTEPHSVFALAGYARLAGGRWAAFAVLINGTDKLEVPLGKAIAATREALTPLLSPLPAPKPLSGGR